MNIKTMANSEILNKYLYILTLFSQIYNKKLL